MDRSVVVFQEPRHAEVVREPLPALQPSEVLVTTQLSAVSAGTELLFYRGLVRPGIPIDTAIPSLSSSFSYPMSYGYCLVGTVTAVADTANEHWLGKRVFCFHPHASHVVTRPDLLVPIPETVSSQQAVFLPAMETAVTLVMDGAPLIGERVWIFGQGVVGLLTTACCARFPLDSLVSIDSFSLRRRISSRLGATNSMDVQDSPAGLPEPDVVFEVSGNPAALSQAVQVAGFGSRIVIGSWYAAPGSGMELGDLFHRKRLVLRSSQVSTLDPRFMGRWDKGRRLAYAWRMLDRVPLADLVTHQVPVSEAPKMYEALDTHPEQCLQVVFTYPEDS